MTTQLTRRGILKALGIGAAAALIEEPIRKLWFVGSNAPVGSRVERLEAPEVAGWVNVGPYAVPVGEDHVAALNSSWWQDQIDNLERGRRRPTQEHSSYWLQDEHKAWTAREGYQLPEPLREMAQRVEESGARIAAIQKQFGLDRIWDEAGREGRALPAGWVFQNGSVIQFGGKS